MGGYGSGIAAGRARHILVEDCLRLSITNLRQWGYLADSIPRSGTATWYKISQGNRRETGTMDFLVDLGKAAVTVFYQYLDQPPQTQKISLQYTRPYFGGKRWWFICPVTGRRCGALYLQDSVIASRIGFSLTYQTQRENRMNRMLTKGLRILERHGIKNEHTRPKGMHRHTFWQATEESDYYCTYGLQLAVEKYTDEVEDEG